MNEYLSDLRKRMPNPILGYPTLAACFLVDLLHPT